MAEPTTAITDFLMAAVAFVLAARIGGWWRFTFLFTGMGALAGGIFHANPSEAVWKLTVDSIGVATFFLIASASRATFGFRALMPLAGAELVAYAIWMTSHDAFVYVIVDYGSGMLCMAILYAFSWNEMPRAARLVLASIAVAAAGAAVQATRLSIHPRFNYNDLYHVIQIVSLILLHRGALSSTGVRIRS